MSHVRLLFAVGATTTAHALGNMVSVLLTKPGALAAVRERPSIRSSFVNEVPRWEPPLCTLPRFAPFDVEIEGIAIPAGSFVLFGIASANRDPAVSSTPDAFDPERAEGDLMSFGFGSHFCPGTHLARHEMAVALDAVLERLPDLHGTDPDDLEPRTAILRAPKAIRAAWRTTNGPRSFARIEDQGASTA